MTFLEKARKIRHRVSKIHMLSDPPSHLMEGRHTKSSGGYVIPRVLPFLPMKQIQRAHTSKCWNFCYRDYTLINPTIDINETNATTGGLELINWQSKKQFKEFDQPNSITQPYAKALMKEANVSTGREGPWNMTKRAT